MIVLVRSTARIVIDVLHVLVVKTITIRPKADTTFTTVNAALRARVDYVSPGECRR